MAHVLAVMAVVPLIKRRSNAALCRRTRDDTCRTAPIALARASACDLCRCATHLLCGVPAQFSRAAAAPAPTSASVNGSVGCARCAAGVSQEARKRGGLHSISRPLRQNPECFAGLALLLAQVVLERGQVCECDDSCVRRAPAAATTTRYARHHARHGVARHTHRTYCGVCFRIPCSFNSTYELNRHGHIGHCTRPCRSSPAI